MERINKLLKKYYNTPPCTMVVGDLIVTEDNLLLGKVHP